MASHSEIIERLGGIRPVAKLLSKPHTTVQGWSERDRIPPEHWPGLVQAAEREGVPLNGADFLPEALRDVA